LVVNSSQGGGSKDTWVMGGDRRHGIGSVGRAPVVERLPDDGDRTVTLGPPMDHGPVDEALLGQQQQQQQ
jgi:hypothetical protein